MMIRAKLRSSIIRSALLLGIIHLSGLLAQQEQQSTQSSQDQSPLALSRQLQQEKIEDPLLYREKIEKEGAPLLELSLNDAIRLALTNNLDIAIQDYSEELTQKIITSTKGFYDPGLTFSVGWSDQAQPTVSALDAGVGATARTDQTFSYSVNLAQNLPTGGDFSVAFSSFRNENNSTFSSLNPQYGGNFQFDFRQPLWRGFRQTQTERLIKLRNLDLQINDLQFESTVAGVIQRVQNQYWELVFSIENYETRRQGMLLALVQHSNNQKRVNIGVSAPIEITSSRAEVAAREQDMITSEVQIINAQNGLKRLLSSNPDASIWSMTLIPSERPKTPDIQATLDELIATAIQRRPELKQIQTELEQNSVDQVFYRKEMKPSVDLRFRYLSQARTGSLIDTRNVPDDQRMPPQDLGGFLDSVVDPFRFQFNTWSIFADIRIPLGNRTNRANLAQVSINERRNMSRVRDLQQAIIVEVRNSYEGLKTQAKALEAARLSKRLSEDQLRGEDKRFSAGLSTNFQVLRFQRDLTNAKAGELRALINYEQAVTALRMATYTIINDSDVLLAKGQQGDE